jgi:Fe-S-cluster containining protein
MRARTARIQYNQAARMSHPCLTCGACCATFRVGFHWSEADPVQGGTVPAQMVEVLDAHRVAMRGTWSKTPRCVALDAEIGVRARCSIHAIKPSVCREVPASWEFGAPSPQCDKARVEHGMPPLTPADWVAIHATEAATQATAKAIDAVLL